jgi:hypothetical protein
LRGVVAGSEIDGAIEFAALNFISHRGRGSKRVAEERADAMVLENGDGEGGKFFGVEARIVGDENGGLGGFRFDVLGDGGNGETHGGEREIVSDEATPAGGAEFDGRSGDARRSAHNECSVARTKQGAKRERRRKWYEAAAGEWCW